MVKRILAEYTEHLLCPRTMLSTCVHYLSHVNNSTKELPFKFPFHKELRFKDIKKFAQDHTANKSQRLSSHLALSASRSICSWLRPHLAFSPWNQALHRVLGTVEAYPFSASQTWCAVTCSRQSSSSASDSFQVFEGLEQKGLGSGTYWACSGQVSAAGRADLPHPTSHFPNTEDWFPASILLALLSPARQS